MLFKDLNLIETIHFFDWWEGRTRGSFLKVGKYTERVDADPPSCLAVVLEYLAVEVIFAQCSYCVQVLCF
jgi:hypothetical protein